MAAIAPRTPSPHGRDVAINAPNAPLWGPRFDDQDAGGSRRSRRYTSNPFSTANAGHKVTTPEKRRVHSSQESFPSPPASPSHHRGISTPKQARSKKTARFAEHLDASNNSNKLDNGSSLLLTPVKTPRYTTPPSTGASRTVTFQHGDPSDAMPTPRKMKNAGKRGAGDILGSKRGAGNQAFEIHTDWNARRPTVDLSEDNAFIGKRIGTTKNQDRLRTSSPKPLEASMSDEEMEERVNNDEGLVFSFRGKKVYRPYEDALDDIAHAEALGYQPIRRSRSKPAVLDFTRAMNDAHVNANDTDEEALTDIEAGNAAAEASSHQASSQPRTSSQQSAASSRAASAFFSWPRTKPEGAKGARKREVDEAEEPATGSAKKAKNLL